MPKDMKPIPSQTVKIYFSVIDTENEDLADSDDRFTYEFNFENESLIHSFYGKTMRTTMFESWVNNVLEKKFKIGSLLHLGTMFEYTRKVDLKNNKIDPFIPQFDIMTIKNLAVKKDQS